jgi:hypothetical protein
MGFMKFGKKDKSNNMDELDIPPPPPIDSLDNMGIQPGNKKDIFPSKKMSLPQMPNPPMPQAQQNFPPPPKPKENFFPQKQDKFEDMPPTFDIPDFRVSEKEAIPEFSQLDNPDIPESPQEKRTTSFDQLFKPLPDKTPQTRMSVMPKKESLPTYEGAPLFIEVTKYKQILKDLNLIKRELKDTDEKISVIVGDINDEEKTFSSLNSTLNDIEKKLNSLEGSIFGN